MKPPKYQQGMDHRKDIKSKRANLQNQQRIQREDPKIIFIFTFQLNDIFFYFNLFALIS